jgi:hypothetical protein
MPEAIFVQIVISQLKDVACEAEAEPTAVQIRHCLDSQTLTGFGVSSHYSGFVQSHPVFAQPRVVQSIVSGDRVGG